MSSAGSTQRKTALCRYFASSGSCYYGENCTFLHESPRKGQLGSPKVNGRQGPVLSVESNGHSEVGMYKSSTVTFAVPLLFFFNFDLNVGTALTLCQRALWHCTALCQ